MTAASVCNQVKLLLKQSLENKVLHGRAIRAVCAPVLQAFSIVLHLLTFTVWEALNCG